MADESYTGIKRPYDEQLNRSNDLALVLGPTDDASSINGSNEDVIKDGGSFKDIWIYSFIRSTNWKPKTTGFNIDGRTGYAEFTNVYISGNIVATGGTIGGFDIGSDYIRDSANSFGLVSTVTASDDVRFWAGSTYANRDTAPARITESGLATFVGVTTLNIKSYTNFETSGRFTQVTDGSGAITFNNSGLRLQTSATATSSCINKWFPSQNIFNNSPTFSASIEWGAIPTTNGVGFIGLGSPDVFTGSGATFLGNHIGFEFQYQAGVWNMYASLNNSTTEQYTLLTTVATSDVFDLILKVNSTTSVDFYYRKNSGSLVKNTITSSVPTAIDNKIWFAMSNRGAANDILCIVYSSSYER